MESNLPVTAKIKIAKCSRNTLNHDTAKIFSRENFPSYGIHQTKTRCNSRPLHNPHLHFRLVKKFHFSQTKHFGDETDIDLPLPSIKKCSRVSWPQTKAKPTYPSFSWCNRSCCQCMLATVQLVPDLHLPV